MDTNFLLSLGLKTNRQLYEEWKTNRDKQSEETTTDNSNNVPTTSAEDVEDLVTINNTPSILSLEEWAILTGENSPYSSNIGTDSYGNKTEERFFNGELIETVTYSENEDGTVTESHKYANGSMAIVTRNGDDYSILFYNSLGAQTKSESVKNNEDGSYTKTITQNGKTIRQEFTSKDSDGNFTMTEYEGSTKLSYHEFDYNGNEVYAEYYAEDGTVTRKEETEYYYNGKIVTEKEPGKEGEEDRVTGIKTYDENGNLVKKEILSYNQDGEAETETITYTYHKNEDGSSYIIATSDKTDHYKVLNYDADGNLTVVYEYEYVSENESTLLTATTYKNGKITAVVDCVLEKNKAEIQNMLKKYNAGAMTLDEVEEQLKEMKLECTRTNDGITVELNENISYSFEYYDVKASILSIISEYTNKNLSYEDTLRNINRLYGNVEIKRQDLHSEHVAYIYVDGIEFTSIYQRKDDIENTEKTYDSNVYTVSDLKKLGLTDADIAKYFEQAMIKVSMSDEEIAEITAQLEAYAQVLADTNCATTNERVSQIQERIRSAATENGKSEEEINSYLSEHAEEIRQQAITELMDEKRQELIPNGFTQIVPDPDGYVLKQGLTENNYGLYDIRDIVVNVVNRRTRILGSLQKEFDAGKITYSQIKSSLDGFIEYTEDTNGITVDYNGIQFFFEKPAGYVEENTDPNETGE